MDRLSKGADAPMREHIAMAAEADASFDRRESIMHVEVHT